jgi:hypothetical protein
MILCAAVELAPIAAQAPVLVSPPVWARADSFWYRLDFVACTAVSFSGRARF